MKAKITSRLDDVNRRIAAQATAAGRDPKNVRLIAVSKTIDCDRIREAYDAGQRRFGENRIQELVEKAAVLPSDIEWHVVGHVQRNKVRPAVQHSYLIHSVDSLQMLQRIDSIAGELGKVHRARRNPRPDRHRYLRETVIGFQSMSCRDTPKLSIICGTSVSHEKSRERS